LYKTTYSDNNDGRNIGQKGLLFVQLGLNMPFMNSRERNEIWKSLGL